MLRAIPTYWYRYQNFGDQLAPYLIEKISGLKPIHVNPGDGVEHISVVGSLLEYCGSDTIVWGTGFAYDQSQVGKPKEICAVRGDLSRKNYERLGIECPEIYGDPGLLLPRFINPICEKRYKIGIIPHLHDILPVYKNYSNRHEDYRIINLSDPIEKVVTEILECEMTISSALHGLIASHAYGVKCRWVEFSDMVIGNGFKFRDYFTTVETNELPLDLRSFPDLANVEYEIPEHNLIINLDNLMESCPIK